MLIAEFVYAKVDGCVGRTHHNGGHTVQSWFYENWTVVAALMSATAVSHVGLPHCHAWPSGLPTSICRRALAARQGLHGALYTRHRQSECSIIVVVS